MIIRKAILRTLKGIAGKAYAKKKGIRWTKQLDRMGVPVYSTQAVQDFRKQGARLINGVWYTGFSVEGSIYGNTSKADLLQQLKDAGIRYSFTDAYTCYVGHWAVWVDATRTKDAENILF